MTGVVFFVLFSGSEQSCSDDSNRWLVGWHSRHNGYDHTMTGLRRQSEVTQSELQSLTCECDGLGLFLKAAGAAINGNAQWSVKCFQLLKTISSFKVQYEFDEFEGLVSDGILKNSHR